MPLGMATSDRNNVLRLPGTQISLKMNSRMKFQVRQGFCLTTLTGIPLEKSTILQVIGDRNRYGYILIQPQGVVLPYTLIRDVMRKPTRPIGFLNIHTPNPPPPPMSCTITRRYSRQEQRQSSGH